MGFNQGLGLSLAPAGHWETAGTGKHTAAACLPLQVIEMTGKEIMDEVGQLLEATAGMDLAHPNVMQTYKYGTQESMVSRGAPPGGRWCIACKLALTGAASGMHCQEQAQKMRAS